MDPISIVLTGLASAVGILWRRVEHIHKETEKKLKICEDDRNNIKEQLSVLKALGGDK